MASTDPTHALNLGALSLEPNGQTSPLLRLPAEIRNIIYCTVLTKPSNTLEHTNSERRPWNEFQYVYRQLHHETKSLHLTLNSKIKLVSSFDEPVSATELFLMFFAALPPDSRALVREVELYSGIGMPPLEMSLRMRGHLTPMVDLKWRLPLLADVCRRWPHITVKYRLTNFNRTISSVQGVMNGNTIAYVGTRYSLLLRRDNYEDMWHPMWHRRSAATSLALFVRGWAENEDLGGALSDGGFSRLQVPNLRFFPMDDILSDIDTLLGFFDHFRYMGSQSLRLIGRRS